MELKENRQSNVATRLNYDDNNTIYGNLMKQSSMQSFFNVNEFMESTTVSNFDNVTVVDPPTALLLFKCFIIGFIILAAIFGNMLVIVSVMQHRKLR